MQRRMYILAALVLALLAIVVITGQQRLLTDKTQTSIAIAEQVEPRPANWAQALNPNFNLHQMNDTLYRSALPRVQDNQWLQQENIQTVINFYQKPDRLWLSDSSIEQIQIPLHTDRINDVDVLRALHSITAAQEKGPVLMHCKHGQNRTGLIAAMYRIVIEGWSKEAAMAEMQQGFGGEQRMGELTPI